MTATSMTPFRGFAMLIAALTFALAAPAAQARVPTPPELERLLAPVALYPDPLLAQVLIAATQPAELAQAAQWSAANPGWEGEAAVRAVAPYGWDPAVQSLAAFPPLLARLAAQPDWLHALGEAFLRHEPQVMDAVQSLRRRAHAAGTLVDDDRLRVSTLQGQIVVQPVDPMTLYLPWYDPLVAYGYWPWHAHPPVVWARWPGIPGSRHGVAFWWGPGMRIAVNLFADPFDWRHRRLHAVHRHAPSSRHAVPAARLAAPLAVPHAAPAVRHAAPVVRQAAPAVRQAAPVPRQIAPELRQEARRVQSPVAPRVARPDVPRPARAQAPQPVAAPVIAAPILPPVAAGVAAPVRAAPVAPSAPARAARSEARREAAPVQRHERVEARGVSRAEARPRARTAGAQPLLPAARSETRLR